MRSALLPRRLMHINIQPVEKSDKRAGTSLDIHSVFHTIQGEGPFCGQPAVFIRLAGCNLQCPGCDTDYTLGRKRTETRHIVENVLCMLDGTRTDLVVITGGEPFRQDIRLLCRTLLKCGLRVQIETNGTLYIDDMPWGNSRFHVVCSPKAGKVNVNLQEHISAYKYVMAHDSVHPEDGLPVRALGHTAVPRVARPEIEHGRRPVYLQPMDAQDADVNAKNLRACIDSCMRFGYILQLQVHKLINME